MNMKQQNSLDALVHYWTLQYKKASLDHNTATLEKTELVIALLHHALEEPPMAGSSKLFWKNLFMQIKA